MLALSVLENVMELSTDWPTVFWNIQQHTICNTEAESRGESEVDKVGWPLKPTLFHLYLYYYLYLFILFCNFLYLQIDAVLCKDVIYFLLDDSHNYLGNTMDVKIRNTFIFS